jgi:hypothetical protein
MRLKTTTRAVIGAAVAVLAFAGLAGAANAATLALHGTGGHRVAQTPCNTFARTQLCYEVGIEVAVLENAKPVGSATFAVTHRITLGARSRDFSELISISDVHLVGDAAGIHVQLGDACGGPCLATRNSFPVGRTLTNGLHGTLTFHDSIAKGQVHRTRTTYDWLFEKAGATPSSLTELTARIYRCDFAVSSTAGCVFPAFTPVMTSMAGLRDIAANIRRIQSGGGHYGRQGDGHPLHRITDEKQIDKNGRFSCPSSLKRPLGKQCDEYPFASTREGGNGVPANSRGRAFVPATEQSKQGGFISTFYQGNRVLNGDAFWVRV